MNLQRLCKLLIYSACALCPISHIDAAVFDDTTYIEVLPPIEGFGDPRAVMIGTDHLLYVADYGANTLFMMATDGTVLGQRQVRHAFSIAQSDSMDLYVGAEEGVFSEPDSSLVDTFGVLYRINLVRFDTTYLAGLDTIVGAGGDTTFAPVFRDTTIYYNHDLETAHRSVFWQEPLNPARQFVGTGILPDGRFLVARTGPGNTSIIDPDTRVILFDSGGTLLAPLGDLITCTSQCSSIASISALTGISVIPSSPDFILTQRNSGTNTRYGVVWMKYYRTADFDGWIPKFDPASPGMDTVDLIRQNTFMNASAIAVDFQRRTVFVTDADEDSVFVFGWNGMRKPGSFGRILTQSGGRPALSRPSGIAVDDAGTLYVVDSGNKTVRRFMLQSVAAVGEPSGVPASVALLQNYPNPFNPRTTISFAIGHSSLVTLRVYDILGREVATLVKEMKQPGIYTVDWDATAQPSGVYSYTLTAGAYVRTKKSVILK